jgi:hypothetical protein
MTQQQRTIAAALIAATLLPTTTTHARNYGIRNEKPGAETHITVSFEPPTTPGQQWSATCYPEENAITAHIHDSRSLSLQETDAYITLAIWKCLHPTPTRQTTTPNKTQNTATPKAAK